MTPEAKTMIGTALDNWYSYMRNHDLAALQRQLVGPARRLA